METNYPPLLVAFNSTELALKALLSAPFDEGNGICLFCLDDECYYTVTLMEKFRADEYTPVSHLTILVQPESSLEAGIYEHLGKSFTFFNPLFNLHIPVSVTCI
jgi:hypothetical protein